MTKQALIELRDRVKAGALDSTDLGTLHGYHALKRHWSNNLEFNRDQKRHVFLAYNDSLDAAVAFLEAVLPGWWALIDTSGQVNIGPNKDAIKNDNGLVTLADTYCAQADTPARALLLATLDVLIEGAE